MAQSAPDPLLPGPGISGNKLSPSDRVTETLLNRVAWHTIYDHLTSIVTELKIPEAEFSRIKGDFPLMTREQIFRVREQPIVHSVFLSFRLRLSVNGRMTIQPYTCHSNIFYFEMFGQIAIQPFSIKKVQNFLNSQMAIRPYTSHLAIHTQTQTQTESEAFKTQKQWCKSVDLSLLES